MLKCLFSVDWQAIWFAIVNIMENANKILQSGKSLFAIWIVIKKFILKIFAIGINGFTFILHV